MRYLRHKHKVHNMSEAIGSVKYLVELDDSDVGKQADKTESTLVSKFGGAAKKVGAAALSASAAVVGAATSAVATLTKQAVSAYADYEQLVGGVETLFGEAADFVQGKAAGAFESAGLSANEYMETVTSFSASLIQSVGGDTEKAAALADQAITDMADNANKMGSSMESIQTAYQGFAKQNYTMLDNLKLGYGGTKEEMQRLLEDAEKISGIKYDLSSYGDIVEAIHVMQENMGIAGTTAEEAASTISGSLAMVSASWQNVVTAIGEGDSEKISDYIGDLVYSIETAAGNLLPTIENALLGISDLVATMVPEIATMLPEMITSALPALLDAGVTAVETLGQGLLDAVPALLPTVTDVIMRLVEMIIEMAPDVLKCGVELIGELGQGLAQALPDLIPMAIDAVLTLVETMLDNVDMLIDTALQLIMGLATGLINAIPVLLEKAPIIIQKLISSLIGNIPKLIECALKLVLGLAEGLIKAIPKLLLSIPEIIAAIVMGLLDGIVQIVEVGGDLVAGLWEGIKKGWDWLTDKVTDLAKGLVRGIKNFFGISSPSKLFRDEIGKWLPEGMAVGIEENSDSVTEAADDMMKDTMKTISKDMNIGIDYDLPDISGYAANLAASMTAANATEIIVPLSINGREIARASAMYMNEQLAWEAR